MSIKDKITSSLPQITDKNRNYVLGAILLAVFLIYYFVVMQPQLSTLRVLNPEIALLKQDLQKAREDLQKMNLYQSQVAQLQDKVKILGDRVKLKEEVHIIMEMISLMANENRVRIEQMVPAFDGQQSLLKTKEGNYFSLPIVIDARAGYHDFGRFLNNVENDSISLNVDKFSIVANPQDTMRHVIRLTLRATIMEAVKE